MPKWRADFQKANMNRLEQQYQIPKSNTYRLILDENLDGADAYFGLLQPECVMRN